MEIEATCGCGAKVKIRPDNGGYSNSSYGIEGKTREEREACSAAFKGWIQAHTACGRSQLTYPTYAPYATGPNLYPDRDLDPQAASDS